MTEKRILLNIQWIKLEKYCEQTGDTQDAVYSRLREGKWLEGIHARKRGGAWWVHIQMFNDWVENGLTKMQQHLAARKRKRPHTVAPDTACDRAHTAETANA